MTFPPIPTGAFIEPCAVLSVHPLVNVQSVSNSTFVKLYDSMEIQIFDSPQVSTVPGYNIPSPYQQSDGHQM